MNRGKKLFKNTIIISIGKICTQMITFFLLPLYTGILTTEEFGTVDLLNTLITLLLPIVTLQIEQAIFRELIEFRGNKNKEIEIISNGLSIVTIQCILYFILFILLYPLINNEYKIFLLINLFSSLLFSIFLEICRGLGETKKYSLFSVCSAINTVVFNVLFLIVFKFGASGMLLGTLLGQLISAISLFLSLNLKQYIKINCINKKTISKLLKYSVPLIPNAISWWVFNASDRVIVTAILGVSFNGILSAASKFATAYIGIYGIFNISWTEFISVHIKDDDIESYFNNIFKTIINLFFSIAICIIAFMPFIYNIMINHNYNEGYILVPILIIASLFNVVVGLLGAVYVAKKDTKKIANTSIISAILNVVLHLLLIKPIGLLAAPISTFGSFFLMSLYRIYDVNKNYFRIKLNMKNILIMTIIVIFICSGYYYDILVLKLLSIVVSIIYSIFLNKNSIGFLSEIIRSKFNNKI